MFNVSSETVNTSGYDMLRPLANPRVSVSSNPKDTLLKLNSILNHTLSRGG